MTRAVACPVCGSARNRLVFVYTVEEAARHFCTETRNPERNARLRSALHRLWPDGKCNICECQDCDFGFGDPHIGGDDEFYAILHEEHQYPRDRWEYGATLARLAGLENRSAPAALDIGAGVGNFLSQLPTVWTGCAVEGSETTRAILREKGHTVFDSLEQAAGKKPFQLISMFQVLEHIADFGPVLRQCRQLIGERGLLAISVPDGKAMIAQERATGCADMPPNHINKWTPQSLATALGAAGFKVEQVVQEPLSMTTPLTAVYMRLVSDARDPRSLAALVYRIRSRPMRAAMLSIPAVLSAVRLLPHLSYLTKTGSFLVIASPSSSVTRM